MNQRYSEWLKQADYDMETAEFMFTGKRYFYAVFMCHQAIEKALKGLFQKTAQAMPPKTHNLILLLNKIGVRPDEKCGKFIARLNEANIATRYPEDIELLQRHYTGAVTEQMLTEAGEVLEWIRKQY